MAKTKNVFQDVKLCVHAPMEFFLALQDMALDDDTKQRNILKFDRVIETRKLSDEMKQRLTAYQRSELGQFFTKGLQFTLTKFIANNPAAEGVPELLKLIDAADEELLLRYMTRSCLYIYWYERGIKTPWEDVSGDIDFLISQVKSAHLQDDELRQRILDFLENPCETKQRYCSLLKQIYNKAYKPVEGEVLSKLQVLCGRLEEEYLKNPAEFLGKYLYSDLQGFGGSIRIHISCFIQQGFMHFMPWKRELPHWIAWGVKEAAYDNKESRVVKAKKLFKALSDDNRFEMLNLLGSRAWYVQELAEKLGIPASSVNYHLNHFIDLGLLDIKRVNHRIYYSVNKAALKDLMDNSVEPLLR